MSIMFESWGNKEHCDNGDAKKHVRRLLKIFLETYRPTVDLSLMNVRLLTETKYLHPTFCKPTNLEAIPSAISLLC